ncbi:MAG TPA: hypothetical protein VKB63_16030, partial [Gemmatimonadales bacterium]|nr:hypothetical protein [Gemmatimonadales bacterium]
MRRHAVATCLLTLALFPLLVPAAYAQGRIGTFDQEGDVGKVSHAGSTTYDPKREAYLIVGSGQNMWAEHDDFHFVWTRLSGNFLLSTRARFLGPGVEEHRKVGWTVRPTLDPNGTHVTATLHGNGLASLQFRRAVGGMTEEVKSPDSLPPAADAVIQLERKDGVFLMSIARFGDTLVTHKLDSIALPDTVYVGLFVCAHNDSV